jgi:hypothetical protein
MDEIMRKKCTYLRVKIKEFGARLVLLAKGAETRRRAERSHVRVKEYFRIVGKLRPVEHGLVDELQCARANHAAAGRVQAKELLGRQFGGRWRGRCRRGKLALPLSRNGRGSRMSGQQ